MTGSASGATRRCTGVPWAVESFDDLLGARARRLARQLIAAGGAGLAATQLGRLERMFAYREHAEDEVTVLVNPQIVWRSVETEAFDEGCLSFNTIGVEVIRPAAVRVAGRLASGEPVEVEAACFLASLLQHETDHLNGILTLDRAAPAERRRAVAALSERRRAGTQLHSVSL